MKKQLKTALAATLALLLALTAIPVSALPRFDAKAEVTPTWTVPEGYNAHDYTKCVEFLEQTDEEGIKNGEKLSGSYDPNDPETWGTSYDGDRFQWITVNGEQRVSHINVHASQLCGSLNISGCTALQRLDCNSNNLTELDISGCLALQTLYCNSNNLTELDASGCLALQYLSCFDNNLTELDVSGCLALLDLSCASNNLTELDVSQNTALLNLSCYNNNLTELDVSGCLALLDLSCYNNNLTELDVSQNTALWSLYCDNNNLTELDLSNNPMLAYDHIYAEGSGFVGYWYDDTDTEGRIYAYPVNGASFEGFYDDSGVLISEGEWSDSLEAYLYRFVGTPSGTVIARFSGGFTPGDIDGNGSVSVADAISTLRLSMGISDGSGLNTDAADMDGNGSVTLADAIIILRIAMGLA